MKTTLNHEFLKQFKDQAAGIGYTATTPFVSTVKTVDKKVLYIPKEAGEEVEIIDDNQSFITYEKVSQSLITLSGEFSTSLVEVSGESCVKIVASLAYIIIPAGISSVRFYHNSGVQTGTLFAEMWRSELDSEDASLTGGDWFTYEIEDTSISHFIKLADSGQMFTGAFVYIPSDIMDLESLSLS